MTAPQEHDLEYAFDPETYEEIVTCCTCGASGGELLTWCPGERLTREAIRACRDKGNIIDLEQWRRDGGLSPSLIFEETDDEAEGW